LLAQYSLFVLKVPLNTNQPTNQPTMLLVLSNLSCVSTEIDLYQ